MKSISILIPIYNRLSITQCGLQVLDEALNYYKENGNSKIYFQIIVIDDGSKDGSSCWVAKTFPNIKLLKGDGTWWWSGSINAGAKYAINICNSDYIILWNDDTTCNKNYFLEVETILSKPQYSSSILVSKVYWYNTSNLIFNFGCLFNELTGKRKLIGYNEKDNENHDKIIKVDWSGGMGTIIPSYIITDLNYFDSKNFPQYFGDCDFFLRAKKRGHNAYAIPNLIIYNNPNSTGIGIIKSWKDIKLILQSNSSKYNLIQNIRFTYRHTNIFFGWIFLVIEYFKLIVRSLTRVL